MNAPHAHRSSFYFWGGLWAAAGVTLLPRFQTTAAEDTILLGLCLFLLLRGLNENRKPITAAMQPLLIGAILFTLYGIVWLGLVRGYFDAWGRWLCLFPLVILVAVWHRPSPTLPDSAAYRKALQLLAALTLFIAALLILWGRIVHKDDNPYYLAQRHLLIPTLLFLPIGGSLFLVSRCLGRLERSRDHLVIFGLVLLVTVSAWTGNVKTWVLWYQAGMAERAWTPFAFDKPEEISAAEHKPYEAARLYHMVKTRLETKGDLPGYWNWTFLMQYRMALQAMRKGNAVLCAQLLPPSQLVFDDSIQLAKSLWNEEFIWKMRDGPADFKKRDRIWVDLEIADGAGETYTLDRFGRVYRLRDGVPWLEWEPPQPFQDAVDLLVHRNVFYVLRPSGEIISSATSASESVPSVVLPPVQRAVAFRLLPGEDSAVVLTDFGTLVYTSPPQHPLPPWEYRFFGRPVVVDMELDPNGKGYYLLDIYGGIHTNFLEGEPSIPCTSPPVPANLLPYWQELSMAIDLALDPAGRGLYVYTRTGELYIVAVNPYMETFRPPQEFPYQGVALAVSSLGTILALEANGRVEEIHPPS